MKKLELQKINIMDTNDFSLSPFWTPRVTEQFKKFAILLIEPRTGTDFEKHNPLSARTSALSEELIPQKIDLTHDDCVEKLAELLQTKIKAHAGVDAEIFNAADVIKKHTPALVPLMYRIATEDFVKSSRNEFKIIECRNATRLASDWKPSLADILIELKHQVLIVKLQDSFMPYNDFAYAILRQLDYEWKVRMPRSFFYPNDVCVVDPSENRNMLTVTPCMPDGDLELSKKMSTMNYELIMIFKRSCMSAMKNYLLMRDLRVGKYQDTEAAVTAIRSIYKRLQERVREEKEGIRLSSDTPEELYDFIKKNMIDLKKHTEQGQGDVENIAEDGVKVDEKNIRHEHEGLAIHAIQVQSKLDVLSSRKPILNLELSAIDEVMEASFARIRCLISGDHCS